MAIVIDRSNKTIRSLAAGVYGFQQARENKLRNEAMRKQIDIATQRLKDMQRQSTWDEEDRPAQVEESNAAAEYTRRVRDQRLRGGEQALNLSALRAEAEAKRLGDAERSIGTIADDFDALLEEYPNPPPEIAEKHRQRGQLLRGFTDPREATRFAQVGRSVLEKNMLPSERLRLAAEIDDALQDGDLPDERIDEDMRRLSEKLRSGQGDPREARKAFENLSEQYSSGIQRKLTKERVAAEILAMREETGLSERQKQQLERLATRVRSARYDPEKAAQEADDIRFGTGDSSRAIRARRDLTEIAVKRYGKALENGDITFQQYEQLVDGYVSRGLQDLNIGEPTAYGPAGGAGAGGPPPPGPGAGAGGGAGVGGGPPPPDGAGGGLQGPSPAQVLEQDPDAYYDLMGELGAMQRRGASAEEFVEFGRQRGVNVDAIDEMDRATLDRIANTDEEDLAAEDEESVLEPRRWAETQRRDQETRGRVRGMLDEARARRAPGGGGERPSVLEGGEEENGAEWEFITPRRVERSSPNDPFGTEFGDTEDEAQETVRSMATRLKLGSDAFRGQGARDQGETMNRKAKERLVREYKNLLKAVKEYERLHGPLPRAVRKQVDELKDAIK